MSPAHADAELILGPESAGILLTPEEFDAISEYDEAGIKEYWIFDRFRRTLTVVAYSGARSVETVIPEAESYESPLMPGFIVPLSRVLQAADRHAEP